jgi:hypothetical protein
MPQLAPLTSHPRELLSRFPCRFHAPLSFYFERSLFVHPSFPSPSVATVCFFSAAVSLLPLRPTGFPLFVVFQVSFSSFFFIRASHHNDKPTIFDIRTPFFAI